MTSFDRFKARAELLRDEFPELSVMLMATNEPFTEVMAVVVAQGRESLLALTLSALSALKDAAVANVDTSLATIANFAMKKLGEQLLEPQSLSDAIARTLVNVLSAPPDNMANAATPIAAFDFDGRIQAFNAEGKLLPGIDNESDLRAAGFIGTIEKRTWPT